MATPSKKLEGKRIRLGKSNAAITQLPAGTEGIVTLVDDGGGVHVRWDNGEELTLNWDAGDRWTILTK